MHGLRVSLAVRAAPPVGREVIALAAVKHIVAVSPFLRSCLGQHQTCTCHRPQPQSCRRSRRYRSLLLLLLHPPVHAQLAPSCAILLWLNLAAALQAVLRRDRTAGTLRLSCTGDQGIRPAHMHRHRQRWGWEWPPGRAGQHMCTRAGMHTCIGTDKDVAGNGLQGAQAPAPALGPEQLQLVPHGLQHPQLSQPSRRPGQHKQTRKRVHGSEGRAPASWAQQGLDPLLADESSVCSASAECCLATLQQTCGPTALRLRHTLHALLQCSSRQACARVGHPCSLQPSHADADQPGLSKGLRQCMRTHAYHLGGSLDTQATVSAVPAASPGSTLIHHPLHLGQLRHSRACTGP